MKNSIDKTTFFMEATLRICSSLEIETALWKCLLYLKDFMPATRMAFHVYEYELGVIDTIAMAGFTGGESMSLKHHLSSDLRKDIKTNWVQGIHYFEKVGEIKYFQHAVKEFELQNASAIVMDLMLESKEVGMVTVANDIGKPFTNEHIELIKSLNKPFAIAITNALHYRELEKVKEVLADDNQYLQNELTSMVGKEIVGADTGLKGVMEQVYQVSAHDSPVLLLGETGTGKEVIANAIHNLSNRKTDPFIKVNCGAIPGTLIDSELFGHEKGAFTGANAKKRGRFERADGGTIFLDEIGELSLDAQVRLLRVLQEKELERVGGTESVKVNVRIIAATHRNLEDMLKEKKFRDDLYFRIKVFPILLPPLRDRISDIPVLVHYLIQKKSRELNKSIVPQPATDSIDQLISYHWPGNIRELENVVERALIVNKGKPLTFDLPLDNRLNPNINPKNNPQIRELNLDKVTTNHIQSVLKISNGKVEGKSGAAALLGLHPNTLRHRMKKLKIPFGRKCLK